MKDFGIKNTVVYESVVSQLAQKNFNLTKKHRNHLKHAESLLITKSIHLI